MSDFGAGVAYGLDVDTGAYEIVIANSLTAAVPQPIFGSLRRQRLAPGPPASIIAHTAAPLDYIDGFTFGAHGDVYSVTGAGNMVVRIPQTGGPQVSFVGRVGRGLFEEPTACAFGRGVGDQGVLFVVTGGGLLAPAPGSGQGRLVAVEVETEK